VKPREGGIGSPEDLFHREFVRERHECNSTVLGGTQQLLELSRPPEDPVRDQGQGWRSGHRARVNGA
jgi:hypothetical protein